MSIGNKCLSYKQSNHKFKSIADSDKSKNLILEQDFQWRYQSMYKHKDRLHRQKTCCHLGLHEYSPGMWVCYLFWCQNWNGLGGFMLRAKEILLSFFVLESVQSCIPLRVSSSFQQLLFKLCLSLRGQKDMSKGGARTVMRKDDKRHREWWRRDFHFGIKIDLIYLSIQHAEEVFLTLIYSLWDSLTLVTD